MPWAVVAIGVLVVGCGPRRGKPRDQVERVAIVGVERSSQGTRIVAIDERGARQLELVEPSRDVLAGKLPFVRDDQPAVSPDGRWLAFVSTRGGPEPRIWIAAVASESVPAMLAPHGAGTGWVEAHPAWTPEGALVFASTRDGRDFDLWQVPIAKGHASGPAVQLTRGEGHEVMPSLARDGTLVYAAVTGATESRIEERVPTGAIFALTRGPDDRAPALSLDGRWLAFARGGELWLLDRKPPRREHELEPQLVAELPLTEETDPAWSPDGRFLFATSILRGDEERPLFSSIVHVDRGELGGTRPLTVRILADNVGPLVRLGPAIVANVLEANALRGNPEYVPELARIMSEAISKARDTKESP